MMMNPVEPIVVGTGGNSGGITWNWGRRKGLGDLSATLSLRRRHRMKVSDRYVNTSAVLVKGFYANGSAAADENNHPHPTI